MPIKPTAMFALADKWVWDFWFARDGDTWHMFFLEAPKAIGDPELRHWNVAIGHATSRDWSEWTYRGPCFAPADAPAWDDYTTWTGSVVRGDDGLWHLFYTGCTRAERGLKQRIGHATSSDLHRWQRVGDGLALDIHDAHYEEYRPGFWHDRAMRDPWVMRDPDGDGWLMYFTARAPVSDEPNACGAIGLASSADLYEWRCLPATFVGGFGQLEVPQVLRLGGRWHCLFSTSKEHWSSGYRAANGQLPVTGTHHLVADTPHGPWTVAPGPFLTTPCNEALYSGKLVEVDGGLALVGFLTTDDAGRFIGQISTPVPVTWDDAGLSLA